MIYSNIDICYLPHMLEVIPPQDNIIRMIGTCNRIPMFNENMIKFLEEVSWSHNIQLELPVLNQLLTDNITKYKNKIEHLPFSFVVNDFGGLHLARTFRKTIILGRFFNKTMHKYPEDVTYPNGPVMGFDLLGNFVSHQKIVLPFTRNFVSYLQKEGYSIIGIDIDYSIQKQFTENIENNFNDLSIFVLHPNWGAHGDNCYYMYKHNTCNCYECTIPERETFDYITVKQNTIKSLGFSCLPIGQCIYWK